MFKILSSKIPLLNHGLSQKCLTTAFSRYNSAFLSQTILSESYCLDIKGEEESTDLIKPVRLNIRACGEREVSVAQTPALSYSTPLIEALDVRKLGGESIW